MIQKRVEHYYSVKHAGIGKAEGYMLLYRVGIAGIDEGILVDDNDVVCAEVVDHPHTARSVLGHYLGWYHLLHGEVEHLGAGGEEEAS